MWPGPTPPAAAAPTGRGAAGPAGGPARAVRPVAGWYALPIALVLLAVAGFFTVFAMLRDDSRVAEAPPVTGDPATGVRVQLAGGYAYFVYVRDGKASPFACSVQAGDRKGRIQLTRRNAWSAAERSSYRYTATFEAPVSGTVTLRCRGTEGPILVAPDGTAHRYLRLTVAAALGLGLLGALAFAVTLARRCGARRRTAPPRIIRRRSGRS